MPSKRERKTSSLPAEIQERIDDVRAGHSTTLSLETDVLLDQLTEIPQQVRELTGLQSLSLDSSAISTLPPWLDELPHLEKIDIQHAPITAISSFLPNVHWSVDATQMLTFDHLLDPGNIFAILIRNNTPKQAVQNVFSLGRRGALTLSEFSLNVSILEHNDSLETQRAKWQFFEFIDSKLDSFLESCQELSKLELFGFPAGRVPGPIRRLKALDSIVMMGTWLTIIPNWLFEIPSLKSINLSVNSIADLPDSLGEAQNLENLDLSYNDFKLIPAGIWKLAALRTLDLERCPIEKIPADILHLGRLSILNLENAISGLPKELVVPPPEIATQGLDAIRRYWLQERDAGVDYLAEAKLLIVGESGAGKTSLAKKILDSDYALDRVENSTEGIDVLTWQFPASLRVRGQDGDHFLQRDFRVNIWDFGGQEIYHSTHQFFLTKRSVYVLVTDERKEDTDFEYWLEIVSLLSDGSPLLIVQNRKQGRQHQVDFGALRQRYPNLRDTLVVDLADNSGLETAIGKIRRELEQLPHIGTSLPKTWQDVRLALEADPRNYISAEDFFGICRANGFIDLDDMRQLGGYLHDLGTCLFFQKDTLLSKTVILKPEWGTTAVYRALDDPEVTGALGMFTSVDLRRIWSDATYEPMRGELLQLMVKFQLCFQVPGSDTYIAPQLLTPSQPTYYWEENENLLLRYEYDVMPKGIVRRLIVALHYQIAPGNLLWRSGAVFAYEDSLAEVVEVYRRRLLTIRIRGGDPRVLLGLIEKELGIIHRSYPGIRFKRFTPCDCETCSASDDPTMFEVEELKDFTRTGDPIQCRRSRRMRDPAELLRLLSPDAPDRRSGILAMERSTAIPRAEPVQPEIFVSYSWGGDSEALVDEIQHRMAEWGVVVTRDKSEIRYRDSIQQFMRRIGAGKCVIVILTKAYFESQYCMYELTRIASHAEFAHRVYPVVLPDAGIFDAKNRLRYVRYWEDMRAELDAEMRKGSQEHLEGIREDLDLYGDIRDTIARLTNVLADMNTLTPEMHRGTNFEQLYQQLAAALQV